MIDDYKGYKELLERNAARSKHHENMIRIAAGEIRDDHADVVDAIAEMKQTHDALNAVFQTRLTKN